MMTATARKTSLKRKTAAQSWLFSISPSCSHSILLAKYATTGLVCATLIKYRELEICGFTLKLSSKL